MTLTMVVVTGSSSVSTPVYLQPVRLSSNQKYMLSYLVSTCTPPIVLLVPAPPTFPFALELPMFPETFGLCGRPPAPEGGASCSGGARPLPLPGKGDWAARDGCEKPGMLSSSKSSSLSFDNVSVLDIGSKAAFTCFNKLRGRGEGSCCCWAVVHIYE